MKIYKNAEKNGYIAYPNPSVSLNRDGPCTSWGFSHVQDKTIVKLVERYVRITHVLDVTIRLTE